MARTNFSGIAELRANVGREVAVGEWFAIEQERIRRFADATEDHQWIHVDEARAARESPYKTTVAHGYLTLSLLPHLLEDAISIAGVRLRIDYGLNRLRFPAPVPAGARIRARLALTAVDDIDSGVQVAWRVTMEREGGDKPVLVADALHRLYPQEPLSGLR